MPWKNTSKMSLKTEFVILANKPNANMSQLCKRFGISRPTGYKWLRRWQENGKEGLVDRSRRPHQPANQTPVDIEKLILQARQSHKGWGGRKIKRWLTDEIGRGRIECDPDQVPSASTITEILKRNQRLDSVDSSSRKGPWKHFEYPHPNDLWQMDFKGEFRLDNDSLCYPLTIVDDHSRYSIAVQACKNQRRQTVQPQLKNCFLRYGVPKAILCDNGSPWGNPMRCDDGRAYHTQLSAWLIRLGINIIHSTPGRPQGKGKNERFNGTLKAEVLRYNRLEDLSHAQDTFDQWREVYNTERPHEALDMNVPSSRYKISSRAYPNHLDPIEYGPADQVRKVSNKGKISFKNKSHRVGKAFKGQPVAIRPHVKEKTWKVYFCHQHIRTLTL